jgi:hypothetical protein
VARSNWLAFALLLWGCSRPPAAPEGPLAAESKVYVRDFLRLSEVGLKATENYAGQTVTEVEGKITNNGSRIVHYAAVSCVFYDRYGQVIKRERVPLIRTDLKPGATRPFRLPFDDVPDSWNSQMPQLVIASLRFV